ncbi:MAG: TIGR02757 family protein [Burkholderiaceae bacterium]|jgi:uncharacterized protein (TIGR02757 family)|nr:TIGR02757 family protein [Burkholderiaceae bacterium]
MSKREDQMKQYLDELVKKANVPAFINDDPVQFPKRFKDKRDIEIAALLTSYITRGKREQTIKSCEKIFGPEFMGVKPYEYVMSDSTWEKIDPEKANDSLHLCCYVSDFIYLCRGLRKWYDSSKNGSLEAFFYDKKPQPDTIWKGIKKLREHFSDANKDTESKNVSSFLSATSAAKRIHLMLRWLCRDDGIVDLGIWKNIKPSELMIPLDSHVGDAARDLGLITQKTETRNAVIALTEKLREFDPKDPIKYDFALFAHNLIQRCPICLRLREAHGLEKLIQMAKA